MPAGSPPADAAWRFWREQVAAAAFLIQPFATLCALLLWIAPPDAAAFAAADPIVRSIGMSGGLFAIPAAALLALPVWLALAWPTPAAWQRSLRLVGGGLAFAALAPLALRLLGGPHLPSFIPPEEGAAPGLSAGLAAGVIEEVLIRLALLPAALAVARRLLPWHAAALVAVLVSGAMFALLHQVGPGAAPFEPAYFAARFIFPGVIMSAAALWPGPAMVVVAHCAAHLVLPLLFV
jgi:hypothetical protein